MQIQVNTDHNISSAETLAESIREELQQRLKRFDEHVTRLEVHLSDRNSDKRGGGDDIRCLIEARLEGHQPNVVSHDAANVKQALTGAEQKMIRVLDKIIEQQRNH
ncbi:HPF/RaiA family ribosome-associated protein [uncultured Methylophaga sp.]|jgi:ribosome-associated translation inhibitor RaiA|uniref:HPF/RaiA family ribosome-associated protein n=1 Tax=uncultured Methylophaga sp. TaxID=285271 RepID=UPI002637AD8B|nr:HPF/RaiA family ribosome-associated protein [uncultured Methylophaga sp.]